MVWGHGAVFEFVTRDNGQRVTLWPCTADGGGLSSMSAEPAALHTRSQTFRPHPVELEPASRTSIASTGSACKGKGSPTRASRMSRSACIIFHAFPAKFTVPPCVPQGVACRQVEPWGQC